MGLECDGSDITAVGALDALVEWLKNSTGREAKVARLESLKEILDEYLVLLKDGIFLMLFKELLEGRLRTKILLDVAPKGKAKDKWKESTEARMLRDLFPENVVISDELLQKIIDTIESRFCRKVFCSGAQNVGKSKSAGEGIKGKE